MPVRVPAIAVWSDFPVSRRGSPPSSACTTARPVACPKRRSTTEIEPTSVSDLHYTYIDVGAITSTGDTTGDNQLHEVMDFMAP